MMEAVYSGRKSIKSVSLVSLRGLILINCRWKSTLLMEKRFKSILGAMSFYLSISIYCQRHSRTFLAGVCCQARLAEKKKIKAK